MAENNNNQNQASVSKEPLAGFSDRVVSMPESFYGTRENLTKPQETKIKYVTVLPPGTPKTPPAPPRKTKVISKTTYIIIGVGVILLLLLVSYLVYLLYMPPAPLPSNTEVEVETPIEPTIPEPEVEDLPPLVDEVPPVVEPPEVIEPTPRILSLMHDTDTDGDRLTDNEEYVLKTNATEQDTDGDGFQDGAEFINFFNPIALEPAQLEFSGLVVSYVNPIFSYNIFYPNGWFARSVDQVGSEVIITSIAGEYISIKVLQNSTNQTADVWYLSQFPEQTIDDIKVYENRQGLPIVETNDGFVVYLAKGNLIYEVRYDIGTREKASYPNIFKMMVDSFIFTSNGN